MKKTLSILLVTLMIIAAIPALAEDAGATLTTTTTAQANVIQYGSRDDANSTAVSEMQKKLIDLGYLSGKADGIFGPRTDKALREFQLANDLTASSQYDDATQAKISSSTVVRRDSYVESKYTGSYNTYNTPATYDTPAAYDTPKVTKSTTGSSSSTTTTGNYNTYNTPDYNTYNTPNTPDYNTNNTPDNTPDYNT